MAKEPFHRFGAIDLGQMRLLARLPPQKHVRLMLEARELVVGLARGRLRRQHAGLSTPAINLMLLEELAREVHALGRDASLPGGMGPGLAQPAEEIAGSARRQASPVPNVRTSTGQTPVRESRISRIDS
jgi:hypothetical protein